jgi:hypothetical protein
LTGALLALAGFACLHGLPAQEGGKREPVFPAPDPNRVGTTLFLLVQVKNSRDAADIQRTLQEAVKNTPGCKCTNIKVKAIPPAVFQNIATLVGLNSVGASAPEDPELNVRELSADPPAWEFTFTSDSLVADKLTVKFAGGKERVFEHVPLKKKKDSELFMTLPGTFVLRPRTADKDKAWGEPTGYKFTTTDFHGPGKTFERPWPRQAQRIYATTLSDFEGDRQEYFRSLKNKDRVTNPFDDVEIGQDFTFTLASLGGLLPGIGKIYDGTRYTPEVPGIVERAPKRVWVLFPIKSKEEFERLLGEYRAHNSASLPGALRKAVHAKFEAGRPLRLTAGMAPTWIEFPDVSGSGSNFKREIELSDVAGLQKEFPQVWRLVVWEGGAADDPTAVGFKAPGSDSEREIFVHGEEVTDWAPGLEKSLRDLLAREKKGSRTPPQNPKEPNR